MIKFYYNLAPNPTKVALALEEMGLQYELVPVDTRKAEQHTPAFLAVNPNAKVPAIVDEGTAIFDSNAILLYLAEKTSKVVVLRNGHVIDPANNRDGVMDVAVQDHRPIRHRAKIGDKGEGVLQERRFDGFAGPLEVDLGAPPQLVGEFSSRHEVMVSRRRAP